MPPPEDGSDFKQIFHVLVSAGAGRPADKNGVPDGPWTPDLLADAISQADADGQGVDLRTVQLWFQDNQRGISATNIRWLARVFGCGDPVATSDWQAELTAANRRLVSKRRASRQQTASEAPAGVAVAEETATPGADNMPTSSAPAARRGLSEATEAMLSSNSALNLPIIVFSGAIGLALISFSMNVHSVLFTPSGGVTKQVGYLWAPNWTVNLIVLLPLYLAAVSELLRGWKDQWRPQLIAGASSPRLLQSWESRLAASSPAFWAVLLLTVVVASGFNWVITHLIPLLKGNLGSWPVDWGNIAILRPGIISVPDEIFFSGLVFLYNGFVAYLFFAALLLVYLLVYDYLEIVTGLTRLPSRDHLQQIDGISFSMVGGVFRATSLGMMLCIMMKLQSAYLLSNSSNILSWLVEDLRSIFTPVAQFHGDEFYHLNAPGFYYSFFSMIAIIAMFAIASVRGRLLLMQLGFLGPRAWFLGPWAALDAAMLLLAAAYIVAGAVPGFTVVLMLALALTAYYNVKLVLGPTGRAEVDDAV